MAEAVISRAMRMALTASNLVKKNRVVNFIDNVSKDVPIPQNFYKR